MNIANEAKTRLHSPFTQASFETTHATTPAADCKLSGETRLIQLGKKLQSLSQNRVNMFGQ